MGILLTKPSGLGSTAAHGSPAAGVLLACSSAAPARFSAVRACMRASKHLQHRFVEIHVAGCAESVMAGKAVPWWRKCRASCLDLAA